MRVFKLFFQLVRAYKVNYIINAVIFIAISLLFAFVSVKEQSEYADKKTKVAIFYEEKSELTEGLTKHLDKYTEVSNVSKKDVDDALYYEIIEVAIFIPNNLEEIALNKLDTIEFQTNLNNAIKMQTVSLQVNKYLNAYRLLYEEDSSLSSDEIIKKIDNIFSNESEAVIPNIDKKDTSGIKFYFNFASYIIFSTLFGSIILIIIKMKKHEVYKRTIVASYSRNRYSLEIALASFMLSLIVMIFVAILAAILDISVFTSYKGLLYFGNLLIYTIAVTAISVSLGFVITNEDTMGMISVLLSLIMAFFSGAFVPMELLSNNVKMIGKIFPASYFISNNNIIAEMTSFSINGLVGNLLIVLGFALLFTVIGVIINNIQIKKEIS